MQICWEMFEYDASKNIHFKRITFHDGVFE